MKTKAADKAEKEAEAADKAAKVAVAAADAADKAAQKAKAEKDAAEAEENAKLEDMPDKEKEKVLKSKVKNAKKTP
jgi:hypothetical protein